MQSWRAPLLGITLLLIGAASAVAQPAAPTKLQALALQTDRIFLIWQDNSNNETNFRIESGTGGSFTEIGTTPANTNAVFVNGLNPATAYSFRVRASNGAGNSAYSNVVTVTTRASNGPCSPTATEICLNNDRFRVQALYQTAGDQSGQAHAVKLTADSGYLWFFDVNNIEAVVKVLNGCGFNNRYWVFAAGLTNVRVVLAVTDTQLGTSRVYVNPLNAPFLPIQDTSALASCP
jgi:hypothetical protein